MVDCEVLFMSGDSSIWERQNTIEKLSQLKSVILVATQVIEAGVAIDIDIGYKDCSKLDSEEQFMGRINRSCKKDGIVYFFNLDSARAVYKDGDIRIDEDMKQIDEPEDENADSAETADAAKTENTTENTATDAASSDTTKTSK